MEEDEDCDESSYSDGGGGSGSGSGSGSLVNRGKSASKKPKPERPQGGLGVAELERLRLEQELEKQDKALRFFQSHLHSNPLPSQNLPISPNFAQFKSTKLPLTHSFPEIPRKDSIFRPPKPKSNLTLPLPGLDLQNQQPHSSPNLSSVIEPPSNQIYSNRPRTSFQPEKDKRIGSKRPYPFSVEPDSVRSRSLPSFCHQSIGKPDETGAAKQHCSQGFKTGKSNFREVPLGSISLSTSNDSNPRNENKGKDKNLKDDSLTFAPPASTPASNPRKENKGKDLMGNFLTLAPPASTPASNPRNENKGKDLMGNFLTLAPPTATPASNPRNENKGQDLTGNFLTLAPPTSTPASNPRNENKGKDKMLKGDSLTLAPPASTPAITTTTTALPPYRDLEKVHFESSPYQIGAEDRELIQRAKEPSRRPLEPYNVFPPAAVQDEQETTSSSNESSCIGGD